MLGVIEVWAAVAWADGLPAEAEAEGHRRLNPGPALPYRGARNRVFITVSWRRHGELRNDVRPLNRHAVSNLQDPRRDNLWIPGQRHAQREQQHRAR